MSQILLCIRSTDSVKVAKAFLKGHDIHSHVYILLLPGPWFLSMHGKDKPTCGTSYGTACFSLNYLLNISYSQTHSHVMTYITDKNISISNTVVVSDILSNESVLENIRTLCIHCQLHFPASIADIYGLIRICFLCFCRQF